MANERLKPFIDWFETYVERHLAETETNTQFMESKRRHTYRVLSHVQAIIRESGAGDELAFAMKVAAVLHDVGRFPQLAGEGSYDDHAGMDHAEAGAAILADSDVLPCQDRSWPTIFPSQS